MSAGSSALRTPFEKKGFHLNQKYKYKMRDIMLVFIVFVAIITSNCHRNTNCDIISTSQFNGDGILLLENSSAQDGKVFITFFPNCQLDTVNLMLSLRHSKQAVIFRVDNKLVWQAIHNHTTVLQSLEKYRLLINREVYLTPVHLSYHETEEKNDNYPKSTFQRVLNTEELSCKYQARVIDDLRVDNLQGM
jgi:hypothetical protein